MLQAAAHPTHRADIGGKGEGGGFVDRGDQRRAHPLQGEVAGAHHHIRLCEDSAQRLLCRVQEELCLRAVEGGGLPYPGQQAVLQRGGDIQVFTALRGQDDTEMGDRQAIVPHIGFELEGSLLDAAADENRPGLPQAAAGLRRLLQGLGPRRQDDGLHRRLHAEGLSNVPVKGADSIQSGVASRAADVKVCGSEFSRMRLAQRTRLTRFSSAAGACTREERGALGIHVFT